MELLSLSHTVNMGRSHPLLPHAIIDTHVDFHLVDFLNSHWQYRGEGNANIVIALEDELRVLRLSKTKVEEGSAVDWTRQKRKVTREVTFANKYFGPLLGLEYVGKVEAIQLKLDEVTILNLKLKNCRPSFRQHKELKVPYGTAHRDFARIHSYPSPLHDYCIEIKPKQGWWPKHLKAALQGLSLPKQCTYCLNQFLKLKRSKITSRTEYCPLDLFSGEPRRMVRAIVALISNPQNNFRIFKNGRLVYGENRTEGLDPLLSEWIRHNNPAPSSNTNVDNLIFLLCSALLKSKNVESSSTCTAEDEFERVREELRSVLEEAPVVVGVDGAAVVDRKGTSCAEGTRGLPGGSILGRILEVQRLGEGVERIYGLFTKICPVHSKLKGGPPPLKSPGGGGGGELMWTSSGDESGCELGSSSSSEFSEDDDDATVRVDVECPGAGCLEGEKWLDELPGALRLLEKKEVVLLQHYLVAATAKDCSIMVTFSPAEGAEEWSGSDLILADLNGREHRVRIGVADLDPKPVTSIVKHFLRDREMTEEFCRSQRSDVVDLVTNKE